MDQLDKQTGDSTSQEEGSFFNRDILQGLLEKAWLILCILAIAIAFGIWQADRSPVIYQSRAVLLLDFGEQKVYNVEDFEKRDKGGADLLNTIASSVKSSAILKRVVLANSLTNHVLLTQRTNIVTELEAVGFLNNVVDTKLRRLTRLIDVTVEVGSPELAQSIAQSVAEEFINQNAADRTGLGTNAGQILLVDIARGKGTLAAAETAMQAYLRTNDLAILQDANTTPEELKSLSAQLLDATSERHLREQELAFALQVITKPGELLSLTSVSRAPEIVALREKLQSQQVNVSNLELRYKSKHPLLIQATNELAEIRRAFDEELGRAPSRLKQQVLAAAQRERGLADALGAQQKKIGELNESRIQYDQLQRIVANERKQLDTLIQRLKEVGMMDGIKKNDVRIMEPALLPKVPIRPNKRMILAYSVMAGLGLSIGLVWLLQQMDTSIKSVDHAERMLGLPVLGAIPRNKLVRDGKSRLFMSDDPQSLCAEAFRSLRASLGLLGRESERKVVFFTSAVPSEGKSFCCVNYAVAYAQQGKRTLVIDFDLRKPSLAESFGVEGDVAGVTDILLGKSTVEQCAQKTRFENLFLITAGRSVPNPAELLAGPWAKELIREASEKFDQVVLDNAPINAVSDSLLIVKEAHTVCLVANARKTSYRAVQRALEMLRRAGVKPSGVILNFLPQSAGSGYYYYYSGNKYYGRKGVYGATSSRG